jgi:hypothetical protein
MDLVNIALGIAAAVGAAFGLVVGNQLTRVEEASSHRDARRLASSSAGLPRLAGLFLGAAKTDRTG